MLGTPCPDSVAFHQSDQRACTRLLDAYTYTYFTRASILSIRLRVRCRHQIELARRLCNAASCLTPRNIASRQSFSAGSFVRISPVVGLGVLSDTHDPTPNNGSDQVSVALDLSNPLLPIPQDFLYLVTIVFVGADCRWPH